MPRFFLPAPAGDLVTITGPDASHIARSLRMSAGDEITLSDSEGYDCHGVLQTVSPDLVTVAISRREPNRSEPSVRLRLFQCLPKGDKLDVIVQKAVELGAAEIVPVLSERCVSRPDERAMAKRVERLNRIAREAAGQSGRGIVPAVSHLMPFREAVRQMAGDPLPLMFYESGGEPLRALVTPEITAVSILIGPEGGFSPEEVQAAKAAGVLIATLGPRILRTETAPIAALSALLFATDNL